MKQQFLLKSLFILALIASATSCKAVEPEDPQQQTVSYTLCNANATAEVQHLWAVLTSQFEQKAMSGVVANIDWNTREAAGNTYDFAGGGAWFWWGAQGAEVYKQLWRFMYDRLVNYHKLNNLIWVWTSQVGDDIWYPGDDVVDGCLRHGFGD